MLSVARPGARIRLAHELYVTLDGVVTPFCGSFQRSATDTVQLLSPQDHLYALTLLEQLLKDLKLKPALQVNAM